MITEILGARATDGFGQFDRDYDFFTVNLVIWRLRIVPDDLAFQRVCLVELLHPDVHAEVVGVLPEPELT